MTIKVELEGGHRIRITGGKNIIRPTQKEIPQMLRDLFLILEENFGYAPDASSIGYAAVEHLRQMYPKALESCPHTMPLSLRNHVTAQATLILERARAKERDQI